MFSRSDGKNWHVFFHFVGAVPGSTSLEPMLKRLLREMDFINVSQTCYVHSTFIFSYLKLQIEMSNSLISYQF